MKAQPKASHYINGSFVDDERGAAIPVIYPATGETIAMVRSATENVVELAVEAAREAQPAWARLKPVERGRILRRAADILRARNAELARLETLDTGKAIQETLVADPASAADALEYFGGAVASYNGDYVDFGGSFAYTRREALGVCVGIGAWNYPIQGAAWKSAPALAMGNADGLQAVGEHASVGPRARRNLHRGRPARRPLQRRAGLWRRRPCLGQPSGRRESLAHRLGADRPQGARPRRLADEARDDGTRRQVAAHHLRRRRCRERCRRRHARATSIPPARSARTAPASSSRTACTTASSTA